MFIRSVMGDETELDSVTKEQLYNGNKMILNNSKKFTEENDPEYNIFQDLDDICGDDEEADEDNEYEFRKDRATEIPRWELKALEEDFVDVPSTLDVPVDENFLCLPSTNQVQHKPLSVQWLVEQPISVEQPTSSSSSIVVTHMVAAAEESITKRIVPYDVPVGDVLKTIICDKSNANVNHTPLSDNSMDNPKIYAILANYDMRTWDKYNAITAQLQPGNMAFSAEQLTALRVQMEKVKTLIFFSNYQIQACPTPLPMHCWHLPMFKVN